MGCEICGSAMCPGCWTEPDNFDPEEEDRIDSLIQAHEKDANVQHSE